MAIIRSSGFSICWPSLNALEGVIWKRRCQVTSSEIGERLTDHVVAQGLRMAIVELT